MNDSDVSRNQQDKSVHADSAVLFSRDAINGMEKRSRTNFVNSLSGFKSANLLGTRSLDGIANLALISSVFHVGANPPLLGMLMRPHTVPRHSLENLLETGVYTLNAVPVSLVEAAHQSSAKYPREDSEFDACGLSAIDSGMRGGQGASAGGPSVESARSGDPIVDAPYVEGSPVQIGLRLVEHHTLACNGTIVVVGEIAEVRLAADVRAEDGWLDFEALSLVTISGLDAYHGTSLIKRLPYAKPGKPVQS